MITLTPAAIEQIHKAAAQSNAEGLALRIAVREAADGSFEYGMGWDEVRDDDLNLTMKGLDLVFAPQFGPMLKGTTIDFAEVGPGQFGFIFMNPNDPHFVPPRDDEQGGGCGCGSPSGCGG